MFVTCSTVACMVVGLIFMFIASCVRVKYDAGSDPWLVINIGEWYLEVSESQPF